MKNIIFDIGNVIVRWEPHNALSEYYPDEESTEEALRQIGFFDWNVEQDRGRSWKEGLALIEEELPDAVHIFTAYVENLRDAHQNLVPGTSELIEELHTRGVRLFGLTNAAAESFELMRELAPCLGRFLHTTVSSEVGFIKPEAEIFEFCLSHNGLDPSETLFVDDSFKNCEGASNVGLATHHFKGAKALETRLKAAKII